jgi:uncharacterized protein YqhQ
VADDKVRLGGMALANGVLVHGPNAWACAIRADDGTLKVVSRRKGLRASRVANPLLRGPARLAEAMLLLPQVKRALPEAKLPFERPRVVGTMLVSALGANALRRSRLRPLTRELASSALSFAPALLALRGGELAAYHGAEHVSIGSYEHGEARPKEHERCGSHLVGPLLVTSTLGALAAERVPERHRRGAKAAAAFGSLTAATELFGWMTRNPDNVVARALARPGHELQHHLGTEEPTAAQLEVAQAALQACLELEHDHDA